MKKNYIERLKEYDARTSLASKQGLYRRKFIKTCYTQNKENEDPNSHKHHSSIRSGKSKSQREGQDTRSSERRECEAKGKEVSHFKEINISPYQCEIDPSHNNGMLYIAGTQGNKIICCEHCSNNYVDRTVFCEQAVQAKKEILGDIRLECVRWQRYLSRKEGEQSQKCKEYYNVLKAELSRQQQSTLEFIHKVYSSNQQLIEERIASISLWLDQAEDSLSAGNSAFCSQLPPQESAVELQMAALALDEQVMRQAVRQIGKFDLLNLGFADNSPQRQSFPRGQLKASTGKEESLTCAEQLVEMGTRRAGEELDISFENWAGLGSGGGGGEAVSPSFKAV